MGRTLNREPTHSRNANDRQLRAVKREQMSRNRVGSGRDDSTQQHELDRRALRSKYLALHNKING